MPDVAVATAVVFEDSGAALLARIVGHDAANIVQAGVTSIQYTVFNAITGAETQAQVSQTVANVIFDTLQTDARWTVDDTGYNYAFAVPAAALPTGGVIYRFEIKLTPASGEVFQIGPFELTARALFKS